MSEDRRIKQESDTPFDSLSSTNSLLTSEDSKISKKKTQGKRKFHKKSRKGCATCKKRRVKCDEQRPICSNCDRMGIECIYTTNLPNQQQQPPPAPQQQQQPLQPSTPLLASSSSVSSCSASAPDIQALFPQTPQATRNDTTGISLPDSTSIPLSGTGSLFSSLPKLLQSLPMESISQLLTSQPELLAQVGSQFGFQMGNLGQMGSVLSSLVGGSPMAGVNTSGKSGNGPANAAGALGALDVLSQMSSSLPELMSLMGGLDTAKPSSAGIDQQTAQPDLSKRSQPQPPQQTQSQPQEIQQPQQPQIPQQSQQQSSQQQSHQQQKPQVYQKQQPDQLDSKNMNNLPNPQLDSPSDFADDSFDLDMQFEASTTSSLNMLDLKLMHHYSTKVWPTITAAGISDEKIWNEDIPNLAFKFPFLMRLILTFSATHLSRTERGLDTIIIQYRAESLKLLREAVLNMNAENTDALVASALILIMDSLANASSGNQSAPRAVPASAWVFHVKGAATILTAVWPLPQTSRFYKFINIDLGDLGDVGYDISGQLSPPATLPKYVPIQCFDDSIADLFPLTYSSPYVQTLSFMHKLHLARHQSDFILRIFAFPALLERKFLQLLITCDLTAMRIMRSYYKLLRDFVDEMKDRVWFLEGVSTVLPVDVEEYSGGGGMNMMVDFLGGGPTTVEDEVSELADLSDVVETDLLDTNNLPSSVPGLGDNNDDPSVAFMGF